MLHKSLDCDLINVSDNADKLVDRLILMYISNLNEDLCSIQQYVAVDCDREWILYDVHTYFIL